MTWRGHLTRHAASGKSIAAFCRAEDISHADFYAWRTKLRGGAVGLTVGSADTTFIDLGAVSRPAVARWRPWADDHAHRRCFLTTRRYWSKSSMSLIPMPLDLTPVVVNLVVASFQATFLKLVASLRSGFSQTSSLSTQFRVVPDQRSGQRSFAAA